MPRPAIMSLALLGLAGCAPGPRPERVVYQTVTVPRPVSCVPSVLGPAPANLETRQTLAAVPEGPDRYARLLSDWFARAARMEETEPVVAGCEKAASPP